MNWKSLLRRFVKGEARFPGADNKQEAKEYFTGLWMELSPEPDSDDREYREYLGRTLDRLNKC